SARAQRQFPLLHRAVDPSDCQQIINSAIPGSRPSNTIKILPLSRPGFECVNPREFVIPLLILYTPNRYANFPSANGTALKRVRENFLEIGSGFVSLHSEWALPAEGRRELA